MEAQRDAILRFAEREQIEIAHWFTEVETGKGSDALDRRPQLASALKAAQRTKCPIIVAKLDRLSRDVHFVSGMISQRVPSSAESRVGKECVRTFRSRGGPE